MVKIANDGIDNGFITIEKQMAIQEDILGERYNLDKGKPKTLKHLGVIIGDFSYVDMLEELRADKIMLDYEKVLEECHRESRTTEEFLARVSDIVRDAPFRIMPIEGSTRVVFVSGSDDRPGTVLFDWRASEEAVRDRITLHEEAIEYREGLVKRCPGGVARAAEYYIEMSEFMIEQLEGAWAFKSTLEKYVDISVLGEDIANAISGDIPFEDFDPNRAGSLDEMAGKIYAVGNKWVFEDFNLASLDTPLYGRIKSEPYYVRNAKTGEVFKHDRKVGSMDEYRRGVTKQARIGRIMYESTGLAPFYDYYIEKVAKKRIYEAFFHKMENLDGKEYLEKYQKARMEYVEKLVAQGYTERGAKTSWTKKVSKVFNKEYQSSRVYKDTSGLSSASFSPPEKPLERSGVKQPRKIGAAFRWEDWFVYGDQQTSYYKRCRIGLNPELQPSRRADEDSYEAMVLGVHWRVARPRAATRRKQEAPPTPVSVFF